MKIKNWTKLSETRWVHNPTGIQIYVKRNEPYGYSTTYDDISIPFSEWEIRYDWRGENKLLDRAETKDQAIKKAINAQKYYNQHHF